MRNILIIFLLIGSAQAQQKGDNRVLIKGITFDQVVKALADQGFFFANKDEQTATAITNPAPLPKPYGWHDVAKITLFIHVKDSTLYLAGKMDLETVIHQDDIIWSGSKNALNKQAFGFLIDVSKKIKPEIEFAKL